MQVTVWHWHNTRTGERIWSNVCPGAEWEHWKTFHSSGVHVFDDGEPG